MRERRPLEPEQRKRMERLSLTLLPRVATSCVMIAVAGIVLMTVAHEIGLGIAVPILDAVCFVAALIAKRSFDRELNR